MLKRKKLYPFYAFLLALILFYAIFACLGIRFGSNTTIISGDLFAQYEGFIRMFLRVLRGEGSLWYTFSIFLGSGTALTYAYYTLSPLNLLYLIPGISFPTMSLVVIGLKHALAAAFFCCFLRRALKRDTPDIIFFSLCYALCTFGVGMYFNIIWFDAVYILPLIIIGLLELLDHKRMLPLILSYTYLFMTNFYMGFIFGVFSALVFLRLLIGRTDTLNRSTLRENAFHLLRYAFCGFLSAGLCAVILLPAGLFLFSHTAPDNFDFDPINLTMAEFLNSFLMGEMTALDNDLPFSYCSLPVLLLLPLYYRVPQISRKDKLLTGGMLLIYFFSSFCLPLYTAMHAFDYPNWYAFRFSYAIVFILVTCACRALPYLKEYRIRDLLLWSALLIVLYSILIPFFSLRHRLTDYGNTQPHLFLNAAFLLLWGLFLTLWQLLPKRKKLIGLSSALLICVELVVNGVVILKNLDLTFIRMDQYRAWSDAITGSMKTLEAEDDSFYRLHVDNDVSSNSATLFGFHSLSAFNSSDDYPLRNALSGLGVCTSNRSIYDKGYYDITSMLLSAKYTLHLSKDLFSSDAGDTDPSALPYSVSRFDYALPLGYMVSASIDTYSATKDPMTNQETLLKAMTDHSYSFYTPLPKDRLLEYEYGVRMEKFNDLVSFRRYNDLSSINYLLLSAELDPEEDLYAAFPIDSPIYVSNSPYLVGSVPGFNTNVMLSSGTLIRGLRNKGDFLEDENGKYRSVLVGFKEETSPTYGARDAIFKIYRGDALPSVYEDLNALPFQITEMSDSDIRGTVTATAERPVLFTSIPYDHDWHAEVDGVAVIPRACVEGAFLTLDLTPGEHDIHLYYLPSGLKTGALISLLSLVILAGHCGISAFMHRRRL